MDKNDFCYILKSNITRDQIVDILRENNIDITYKVAKDLIVDLNFNEFLKDKEGSEIYNLLLSKVVNVYHKDTLILNSIIINLNKIKANIDSNIETKKKENKIDEYTMYNNNGILLNNIIKMVVDVKSSYQ